MTENPSGRFCAKDSLSALALCLGLHGGPTSPILSSIVPCRLHRVRPASRAAGSLHCPFSSLTSMADNKLHSSSYPGVHIWRHPISCCHVGLESWLFKISFSPNRDGPRPPVYTLEKVREIELLAVISKSKTTYSFLPCLNLYLDNRSLR